MTRKLDLHSYLDISSFLSFLRGRIILNPSILVILNHCLTILSLLGVTGVTLLYVWSTGLRSFYLVVTDLLTTT